MQITTEQVYDWLEKECREHAEKRGYEIHEKQAWELGYLACALAQYLNNQVTRESLIKEITETTNA